MTIVLTVLHVAVALCLVLSVLLQAGKGAGIGAAFGGSSDTMFGSRGPVSFLSKLTTGAAVLFMVTSLLLTYVGSRSGGQGGSIVPAAPIRTAPAQQEDPPAAAPKPAAADKK